jgi:hypothetical protein
MPADAEAAAVAAVKACASASALGEVLGGLVATWGGAPSARLLVAAIAHADRLDALPLAYALVYQVRLYGTTQYVRRLTPAVYAALVRAAERLGGDADVVVLADRMLRDAIVPTGPTVATVFRTLLRTGDHRRLWAWHTEYRAWPRVRAPAPGTAPAAAVEDVPVPAALEAAVRRYLRVRAPASAGR